LTDVTNISIGYDFTIVVALLLLLLFESIEKFVFDLLRLMKILLYNLNAYNGLVTLVHKRWDVTMMPMVLVIELKCMSATNGLYVLVGERQYQCCGVKT
jgi:hypothetical protein